MKPKSALRSFLALTGSSLLAISYTHAASLYWDGADSGANAQGGAGTWDNLSSTNWDTAPIAGADSQWDNTNTLLNPADIAVFGGTASALVNLGSNIIVGGITFDTTAYTINTGANTLTLGATDTAINLGSVAAATISGTITGTNLILSGSPTVAGTLTLNSTGSGWTGTTTVNAGRTLLIGQTSQALASTSAIAINGGTIRLDRVNDAIAGNQIADGAAITFNGGGSLLIRHNTAMSGKTENIGAVTVASGQANFDLSNSTSSGGNSVVLTSLTPSVNTAAFTFANGGYGSNQNNMLFKVTGEANTAADGIIGPWATYGAFAANQNDYAIYTGGDGTVTGANIAASAQSAWSTDDTIGTGTLNNTLANASGSAADGKLNATRIINSLRNTTTATATTSVDAGTETFTLTGHGFVNGDVVSASGTGGLTAGLPYYIINVSGDTFQLSATSGGVTPVLLSNTTAGQIAGGITLSAGNNLGTTGILNGSTTALAVGGSGGVVTLPTTTSGNLFVTAGAGAIAIDVPITNNGAGILTLVKSGNGALRLSGANDYGGGTVINAGSLTYTTLAAGMDGTGKNITFGGTGTLDTGVNGWDGAQLTVAVGAVGTITGRTVDFTTTTGAGTVIHASGNAVLNLGNASAFTGSIRKDAGGDGGAVQFSSLSDASGSGNLIFAGGSGDSNQRITMRYNGTSALTFDNRSIELLPKPNNWGFRNAILENNSASAAHTWVINTDVVNSTDRNAEFTLSGSNAGDNGFAGVIGDSTRGTYYNGTGALSMYKFGTGKWIVSGANTYTGLVIVNQGTLSVGTINETNAAGPLGMNNVIQLGGVEPAGGTAYLGGNNSGTLEYTGGGQTSTRSFRIGDNVGAGNTGGGGISNNGSSGALVFSNSSFNTAVATATGDRTLTLGGTNTGVNEVQGAIVDNSATGNILLAKSGDGRWILSNTNTYTGTTTINGGALQAVDGTSLPTTSILQLRGGVFQSSGTFTRTVGTAAGNVNWATGSGGFAAIGGTLTLTLNGGTGSLTWNGSSMVSTGQALIFGSTSADSLVDFQNSINLGSSGTNTRTITVVDNPGSLTDIARISGNLTNTAAGQGLLKDGDGTLELTGTNTYTGATTVSLGTLALVGGSQASAITVAAGASLGFTLGSSTISSSTVNLTNGTVKITGATGAPSYLLMTASGGITGTPTLFGTVPGYELVKANSDTELRLNSTGPITDPYDLWSGGATFDADANNDGVKNGMAWVLGATDKNTSAVGLLPTLDNTDPTFFIFNFRRDDDAAGDANTTLTVQYGSDLVGWTAAVAGLDIVITPSNDFYATGVDKVEVKIRRTLAVGGKLFARLNAVKAP